MKWLIPVFGLLFSAYMAIYLMWLSATPVSVEHSRRIAFQFYVYCVAGFVCLVWSIYGAWRGFR